jgi:hypothetical protein
MAADLEGLATAAALDGEPRTALVYLGAAQALQQASGGLTIPVEQDLMNRLLDANLDSLSPGTATRPSPRAAPARWTS